jgi:hypothetical protein
MANHVTQNELQGSRLYKALEKTAKEQYLESLSKTPVEAEEMEEEEASVRPWRNPLQLLQDALLNAPDGDDSAIVSSEPEDLDDWMDVDPEALEQQLLAAARGMNLEPDDLDEPGTNGKDEEEALELESNDDEDHGGERMMDLNGEKKKQKAAEKKEAKKLEKVVERFRSFVSQDSGLGGALFPG